MDVSMVLAVVAFLLLVVSWLLLPRPAAVVAEEGARVRPLELGSEQA